MASETLSLGTPPIRVNNQGFGLVFHASTDFLGVSCDGLFVRPRPAPLSACMLPKAVRQAMPQTAGLVSIHSQLVAVCAKQLISADHATDWCIVVSLVCSV